MNSIARSGAGGKRPQAPRLLAACVTAGSLVGAVSPASAQAVWQPLPAPAADQGQDGAAAASGTETAATPARRAIQPTEPDAPANPVTGSVPAEDPEASDFGRTNTREAPAQDAPTRALAGDTEAPGIRLGTMTLRPALMQRLGVESNRTGGDKQQRTFWETGLKGSLTSDWSRHQLTITGEGYWQRNLSGDGATDPRANIDADLRLDLSDSTTAHLRAGYGFSREDTNDPNAISGASVQSGIHHFTGGASVEHDFGRLRGTLGADVERWLYSDVELSDGTQVSLSDRNRTAGTLRARLGYEISPALIPFVEASIGRVLYDEKTDSSGYARSADVYAAKAGISSDFGEKLRGELSLGYRIQDFDDSRLEDIAAVTVDGNIAWSPHRGTDVDLRLSTTIDPSTTAGVSGAVIYALNAAVTHQLRSNLVARLTGGATWTDYPSDAGVSDSVKYTAGAGLTYSLNRYLDLTADVGYEYTDRRSATDSETWNAMVGLTAKR
ncbi:hypothetical protein DFR48_10985 [Ciceribacter lividus]|uniref:Beta-barrel porin 2 n=1 Tax=Ciceribacter lividus TaxID=1197950 RepID=A0A6I7HKE5_9HYPH|nr:outer membrane beta-barrel protein [Ciceribacter lividus]RCW21974.1 hypothetical protein DFR48_10985 [Ciceribacter lividus]